MLFLADAALGETRRDAGRYYRPELDLLRLFAFIGTFLFHRMDVVPTDRVANPWGWMIGTVGAFGVPIFFLLSAFLITELLLRERDTTGRVHVGAFYARRSLRIWPLYFAAFFGLAALNHVIPGTGTDDPRAWLAFSLFAGNWWVTFKGWIAGPVDPLWSISVEEQYYLIVPFVIAFGGRTWLLRLSVAAIATSFIAIGWYAWHRSAGDHGQWTNSLVHIQFFAAGSVIALSLGGRIPQFSGWVRIAGLILALACWVVAVGVFEVRSWDPQPSLPGAFAGWFLVLAGTILAFGCFLGLPRRFVPRPFAYLGRISYGLYVFHSLIFMLVFRYALPKTGGELDLWWQTMGAVATFAITIGCAHVSYTYFEKPILRMKSRFSYVGARED